MTREEVSLIGSRLTKLPFEITNWLGCMTITFYSEEPDQLVVIMDCRDEDLDMLYGAASGESYAKLTAVLDGIGEPL